jgi:hypothetical protein
MPGHDVNLSGALWVKSKRSSAQGNNCVELARVGGVYAVRDSKHRGGPVLAFTGAEWDAFLQGVKGGAFGLSTD